MIDVSSVVQRFLMLSSIEQADEKIQSLCQSGVKKVQSLIKEDADESDDRIINAAACDAFYSWALISRAADTDALKSFRAGDITVEDDPDAAVNAALMLKNSAFDALGELLSDNGFYFSEVLIDDVRPTF